MDAERQQIVVLSPEAEAFRDDPAQTTLTMPMIDGVYGIDCPKKWFVISTNPSRYKAACEKLEKIGVETYTPVTRDWRKQSAKDVHQKKPKVEITRPLLVGYSFVRLPTKDSGTGIQIPFHAVTYTDGVREIVGNAQGPVIIDDMIIAKIKEREQAGEFDSTIKIAVGKRHKRRKNRGTAVVAREDTRSSARVKETRVQKWVDLDVKARVIGGPFNMLCGVIEEILPNERVKLGMSLFGRQTNIEIGLDAIVEEC